MSRRKKRKLTSAERRARKLGREEFEMIFINGKQKWVRKQPTVDIMDVDEFFRQNADPIWLIQNEMWEVLYEHEQQETAEAWNSRPTPDSCAEKTQEHETGAEINALHAMCLDAGADDLLPFEEYNDLVESVELEQLDRVLRTYDVSPVDSIGVPDELAPTEEFVQVSKLFPEVTGNVPDPDALVEPDESIEVDEYAE